MRTFSAVAGMVVLAMAGALAWGGAVTTLWERTFAQRCQPDEVASHCLLTLPADVVSRFDDHGADTQLTLEIPDAPEDTVTANGSHQAVLSSPDAADRLGIRHDDHTAVRVTLFDTEVVAVTGPTGETQETGSPTGEALLVLLATSVAAIVAVAGGGRVWRRVRGGNVGWTVRAAVSATIGAFAGMAAGVAARDWLGVAWVMPAAFAATAAVGLVAAVVRLPFAEPRAVERTAEPAA